MKSLRIGGAIALLLLLSIPPLQGLDVGGSIDQLTSLSGLETADFYQENKLSLWLESGFGDYLSVYLQGSYIYTTEEPYFFDLDFLRFKGEGASPVGFILGRFATSDFSGLVLDHRIDGLLLTVNYAPVSISATAGYTGLLFKESSSIMMSRGDLSDTYNEDVLLAPPRLVGGFEVLFPELFLRQDLSLAFWIQWDFRSEDELVEEGPALPSIQGGLLQTQYSGLGLAGPLAPSLYYDVFFYLGTGKTMSYIDGAYEYAGMLSYLSGAGLRYYREEWLYSRIGLKFVYSSGDEDYESDFIEGNTGGKGTLFVPISRSDLSLVFAPNLGNLILAELSYSLKPLSRSSYPALEKLQTELKVLGFFRPQSGEISEAGLDPDSDAPYLGTELDGIINFRPFSDLGLALSGGIFFPATGSGGAFLEDEREIELLGRIEISFSY